MAAPYVYNTRKKLLSQYSDDTDTDDTSTPDDTNADVQYQSSPYEQGDTGASEQAQPTLTPQAASAISQDANNPFQPQIDRLQQQYPTPLLDMYKQFLQQTPPSYDQYKPSWKRRLLAMAGGMGGDPNISRYILEAPYQRAVARYDMRAKQLGQAAGVEERDIANKRAIVASEALNEVRNRANDIRQQMADIANEKNQNIYDIKSKELEQKLNIAMDKLDQTERKMGNDQANAQARLDLQRQQMELRELLHKLDLDQKDRQLTEQQRLHDAQIANLTSAADKNKKMLERMGIPTETTQESVEYDASGQPKGKIVKKTTKGDVQPMPSHEVGTMRVRNKKTGQTGTIGKNKFDPSLYEEIK